MGNDKMGYEGQIFIGGAGATGGTLVQNATDMSYNTDTENGSTTVRGTSTGPPVETGDVTSLKVQIQFTMINDITDTVLVTLRTAASSGNGIALRLKDYSAGKGFDGDVTLGMQHGMNLKGEQTIQFTATPSRGYGRAPLLYV